MFECQIPECAVCAEHAYQCGLCGREILCSDHRDAEGCAVCDSRTRAERRRANVRDHRAARLFAERRRIVA